MKINLKKIKKKLSGLPRIVAERSFLFSVFLLLLSFLIALFFVWKYYFSIEELDLSLPKIEEFNQKKFEEVLKILEDKDRNLKEIEKKEYKSPF
jgi:hypothetical protein